jgi:hypothetical protein
VDIQSGLRAWTKWRGYDADVFTQLADFNPEIPEGIGFSFEDVQAEIDAGYPVLVFLQRYHTPSRTFPGETTPVNPDIHGMLIYGYLIDEGVKRVYYKTSWGIGENFSAWAPNQWQAFLPVRGVIGYRPKPKITHFMQSEGVVNLAWDGPATRVYDAENEVITYPHRYVVEKSLTLDPADFSPVTTAGTNRTAVVSDCCGPAFFRVRLEGP